MALFYPLFYMERSNVSFRRSGDPKRTRNRSLKALYTAFIEYAVSEESGVLSGHIGLNTNAIKIYENSGAHDDWRTVQMDETTMRRYIAKQK